MSFRTYNHRRQRPRGPVLFANHASGARPLLRPFGIAMTEDFHLIDLVSQAGAVRKRLVGKTDSEKLAWLAGHGTLEPVVLTPDGRQTYRFESTTGQEATFFFDAGELVFVGDHTTFIACDE